MKVYLGPYPEDESEREVEIELHDYDSWSADHTMALIILPLLKQLKETTHGAPMVDNEDVPEELRAPEDHDWTEDIDDNHFARWDWVLDEMMYAFEHIIDDDWSLDRKRRDAIDERVANGLRLFGKYYRALWD